MGLDMYAMITTEELPSEVDFKTKDAKELHYWRKHPNLHGWMRQLYYDKGGSSQSFNCVSVALTLEDLDELEIAVREGTLPETMGFFFRYSDGDEKDDDLDFIENARKAIAAGNRLYYYSWW